MSRRSTEGLPTRASASGGTADYTVSRNPLLREHLLSTGDDILAESSPSDLVWGIGCGEGDPAATCLAARPGRNLLGFALMQTRDLLRDRSRTSGDG